MVSNENSVPMSPPAVAASFVWAMELPNSCFGGLHKKSDHIWSTATLPKVKYVRPTSHQASNSNAVVLHSTAVYDYQKNN